MGSWLHPRWNHEPPDAKENRRWKEEQEPKPIAVTSAIATTQARPTRPRGLFPQGGHMARWIKPEDARCLYEFLGRFFVGPPNLGSFLKQVILFCKLIDFSFGKSCSVNSVEGNTPFGSRKRNWFRQKSCWRCRHEVRINVYSEQKNLFRKESKRVWLEDTLLSVSASCSLGPWGFHRCFVGGPKNCRASDVSRPQPLKGSRGILPKDKLCQTKTQGSWDMSQIFFRLQQQNLLYGCFRK